MNAPLFPGETPEDVAELERLLSPIPALKMEPTRLFEAFMAAWRKTPPESRHAIVVELNKMANGWMNDPSSEEVEDATTLRVVTNLLTGVESELFDLATMFIYPGHPIVIAAFIVDQYATRAMAEEGSAEHPHIAKSLRNNNIPGPRYAIYAALDFLWFTKVDGLDKAIAMADHHWVSSACGIYQDRFEQGNQKAALVLAQYRDKFVNWPDK